MSGVRTTIAALGFLVCTLLPAGTWAHEPQDSLLLNRVFAYKQTHVQGAVSGFQSNVYLKHLYQTHQRNAALWVIPSMYALARGQRAFVSEQYNRLTFNDVSDYKKLEQVYFTTIPHQRHTMPTLMEFLTPNLYDATMYGDHILSPFNRSNRVFYKYNFVRLSGGKARLYFRPRYVRNTQLVRGQAVIDQLTGRIDQVELDGEFDMIRFQTLTMQGDSGMRSLLPKLCKTDIDFRFLGNHISSHFEAVYDCPITLPDSVHVKGDRQLIDSVRPYSLSAEEQAIYDQYDSLHTEKPSTLQAADSTVRKRNYLKDIGWDLIGENLLQSMRAQTDNGYVKLSPIINPQYLSYSHRKGFSYKLKLGAQYRFSPLTSLDVNPTLGYNFKLRKFYYNLPFRFTYDPQHDGHADITWGNGNRIANSAVLDELREEQGDNTLLDKPNLDLFDDQHLRVTNSYQPLSWLGVELGLVFHRRQSANAAVMQQLGRPSEYRSLAPMVGLKLRPWRRAPLFSIDWERGLRGKTTRNYLEYERWEMDASVKHRMPRMQTLNMRVGGGFYTHKQKNYFMDYSNFRDDNLPEGWDDDWSGDFQLLSSHMYNASDYYVRGNISFESPLLAASFLPVVGRYVERERAYASTLLIAHTRPYTELGYGLTCRYFSMGLFASFLLAEYQELGCKFTFELFRRW